MLNVTNANFELVLSRHACTFQLESLVDMFRLIKNKGSASACHKKEQDWAFKKCP